MMYQSFWIYLSMTEHFTLRHTCGPPSSVFAWNDTTIQKAGCQVVFYMDAIGHIRNNHKTTNTSTFPSFARLAHQIYHSPQGYAQYQHRGGGGAFGEFRRIQVFSKDLPHNIQASMEWMKAQPDFRRPSEHNCTLYENRYMGYAVRPTTTLAVAATRCFWPRYSLEVDSWRDQPLWCYCLDKTIHDGSSNDHDNHHPTTTTPLLPPLPLTDHQDLWQLRPHRMGKKMKHQYHSEYVISNVTTSTSSTIHDNNNNNKILDHVTPTKLPKRRVGIEPANRESTI